MSVLRDLGVRVGLPGGTELGTVDQVRELAQWAGEVGFDSLWVSQATAVDPVVALAAAAPACEALSEVGTSVVPLYGRHPVPVAQMVRQAAADAGRAEPRIMALIRLCITDDVAGAYALAQQIGARYAAMPSYAAALAREGLDDPGDLHLIGSAQHVLDGLSRYADAGVTDFRLEIAAHDERSRQTSREALAGFLG